MGTAVVLVHGLRASRTMWRAQLEALDRAGVPATAVDLPGHGTRRGERFTLEGAVAAVAQAADGVGGRVLVVGMSLGGYVGIAHAARHPGQVAGLVAAGCCSVPRALPVQAWATAVRGIERLPDRGAWLNGASVRAALPAQAAADVAAGGFALDVVRDVLREVGGATPLADLASVDAPVWLVNGRFDHFRGDERRFLAACRDGRLVVVPRTTHLVSLLAPVAFTRVLLEALDVVEARERRRVGAGAP
ncbi:alpha/beta fold hydrolase [Cellulomonas massiliensis]|uniref:alpha/beta fold hydrolase n=1 Tax=Cellulomonas massiliensis TaxID=1465811 RepID=UPI00031A3B3E|nr:alpha/beta hydrolase [Cellulomonas massiliensis]